jgi:hypothetical protein
MKTAFMKISRVFTFETLRIKLPFGKTVLMGAIIFPLIIAGLELLFRSSQIYTKLPPPTVIGNINYPEIDVKYQIFESENSRRKIDCLFLGNSMVDLGIAPEVVFPDNKPGNDPPNCYNFGMESMMPETSSTIAKAFINKYEIKTIFIGISAVDFVGDYYITRDIKHTPWLQYLTGQGSFEGQLVDKFIVYRYFLALGKYRDPIYQNTTNDLSLIISQNGRKKRGKDNIVFKINPVIKFPNYSLNQPDVTGLSEFGEIKSNNIQVIVIEMPVNPKFLPYYIKGGEQGYEDEFINPINHLLEKQNVQFIRSQPDIQNIVSEDGWLDYSHLNEKGSFQFSRWLAQKIASIQ